MSTNVPDYAAHLDGPDEKDVKLLQRLAFAQERAERDVAIAVEQLKQANARLQDIAEKQIPETLERMGLQELTTEDGLQVTVEEKMHVHVSEERREGVCDWLEAHNQSGIVKRSFNILFSKEDEVWARAFEASLRRRKRQLDVVKKREVHPSTLKKVLNQLIKAKVEVPLELFGIHRRKVSKVERKKTR